MVETKNATGYPVRRTVQVLKWLEYIGVFTLLLLNIFTALGIGILFTGAVTFLVTGRLETAAAWLLGGVSLVLARLLISLESFWGGGDKKLSGSSK
jgi:hypothetical protein